jgi:hypothetical protein
MRPHASSAAAALHHGPPPVREITPAKPAAMAPSPAGKNDWARSPIRPDTLPPIQMPQDRNGTGHGAGMEDGSRPSSKGSSAVDSERGGQKTNRMGLGHLVD